MTDLDKLVDALVRGLPEWLPAQRWFAGKDRPVTSVAPLATTVLLRDGDDLLLHVIVSVGQDDRAEPYQLLVGARAHVPEHLGLAVITAESGVPCYEASGDGDLTGVLLDLLVAGEPVGALRFEREPGAELTGGLRARPITTEQSNTSLVYGSRYILKLFRKLSPGPNPDLMLHRALHEVGCEHIAAPLGSITGDLAGEQVTIGLLQRFLPGAVDGWAMATTSVRDLMADEPERAADAGGDFAGESHRLGQAVAAVHSDLATALGRQEAGEGALDRAVIAMHARLDDVSARVPELARYAPGLRAVFDAVRTTDDPVVIQYIHGDLHLGQVLRTANGWVLIDFEGEPAAPVAERAALRSPLRDVAGMLRSFDYAAHQMLIAQPGDGGQGAGGELAARALDWSRRNRSAFCDGYAEASGPLGDPRAHADLLRAFELDKAVYEVAYEHANRPEWLTVPLTSIARISQGGE